MQTCQADPTETKERRQVSKMARAGEARAGEEGGRVPLTEKGDRGGLARHQPLAVPLRIAVRGHQLTELVERRLVLGFDQLWRREQGQVAVSQDSEGENEANDACSYRPCLGEAMHGRALQPGQDALESVQVVEIVAPLQQRTIRDNTRDITHTG